jgi:hypothetical protein
MNPEHIFRHTQEFTQVFAKHRKSWHAIESHLTSSLISPSPCECRRIGRRGSEAALTEKFGLYRTTFKSSDLDEIFKVTSSKFPCRWWRRADRPVVWRFGICKNLKGRQALFRLSDFWHSDVSESLMARTLRGRMAPIHSPPFHESVSSNSPIKQHNQRYEFF